MNDVTVDVGQAKVAARVAIGKLGMVETHEVQNGCVQIVRVHRIFNGCCSIFVGQSMTRSSVHAATGEEASEIAIVMATPLGVCVLPRRATKLGTSDDECIVEQSTLPQVLDQASDRSVDVFRQARMLCNIPVMVPIRIGANIE